MSTPRLFSPAKVGNANLKHRVVMAPTTRFRADSNHVPSEFAKTYYEQRASVSGTLIITEATLISPQAAGYKGAPGIWSEEQIAAWKSITDAVHAKGSYIYCQLWALGRQADPSVLREEGGFDVVSSSAVAINEPTPSGGAYPVPRPLTTDEIQSFIQDFATAAKNAITAGFDGVELHGANSYLIDQFWKDAVNQRTDAYGGSIENRARFGLEVTRAAIAATGDSRRVAMRLSPWSTNGGMGATDAHAQFLYIVRELRRLDLAYLHLVEPWITASDAGDAVYPELMRANDPLIEAWGPENAVILASGFTREKADRYLAELYPTENVLIAFGRYFISTPDLPYRLEKGIALNPYDRPTFYDAKAGARGYIDYPFSEEFRREVGIE